MISMYVAPPSRCSNSLATLSKAIDELRAAQTA